MPTYEVTAMRGGNNYEETVTADFVEDVGDWVEFRSNVDGLVLRLKIANVSRIERKGD